MNLPRVKICGLTRPEDVLHASRAGADALGFVSHAPSPRHVDHGALPALIAQAPADAWRVLVLVDPTPAQARALCEASGANALQLCGSESAEDWRAFPLPILRRIAVQQGEQATLEAWRDIADACVLEHPTAPGGSGRTVEPGLAASFARSAPCLLAGGLDATNVSDLVRAVRPVGVDASSRLEARPGVKDHALVERFVQAAREALS